MVENGIDMVSKSSHSIAEIRANLIKRISAPIDNSLWVPPLLSALPYTSYEF